MSWHRNFVSNSREAAALEIDEIETMPDGLKKIIIDAIYKFEVPDGYLLQIITSGHLSANTVSIDVRMSPLQAALKNEPKIAPQDAQQGAATSAPGTA